MLYSYFANLLFSEHFRKFSLFIYSTTQTGTVGYLNI